MFCWQLHCSVQVQTYNNGSRQEFGRYVAQLACHVCWTSSSLGTSARQLIDSLNVLGKPQMEARALIVDCVTSGSILTEVDGLRAREKPQVYFASDCVLSFPL